MISIVIPNYNGADWLEKCLPSLEKSSFPYFEVIVVDNGSTDESFNVFEKFNFNKRWVPLRKNFGFAKAVNIGIQHSGGSYVFLLNNDTYVEKNTLQKLFNKIENLPKEYAAVQPLMVSMDAPSIIDDGGDSLSWYGEALKEKHGEKVTTDLIEKEIFSPSGGAALYRSGFLYQMKNFDEKYESYLEDIDLGLRGKLNGYKYLLLPEAIVQHKGHGSRIPSKKYVRLITRNRLMLFAKNIPRQLLAKHFFKILYGQIYFFLAHGRPVASILGYVDFFKIFGQIKKERKNLKHQQTFDITAIDKTISTQKPAANFSQVFIDFFYNILKNALGRK